MAALTDFYVKQHDTREPVTAICQDANGTAVNLTGATAKFFMKSSGGASKVNASATITDYTNGVVSYQWVAADTDTAGDYTAEFQITFGDARILTFPNSAEFNVHIRADLGS